MGGPADFFGGRSRRLVFEELRKLSLFCRVYPAHTVSNAPGQTGRLFLMVRTERRSRKRPKSTIGNSHQVSAPAESLSAWKGLPRFLSREHWEKNGNPFDQVAMAKSIGVARLTPIEHWNHVRFTIENLIITRWCARCLGRTDIEAVAVELLSGELNQQEFEWPERHEDLFIPGEAQALQDLADSAMVSCFHPVSNLFPRFSADERQQLVEKIRTNGLRRPIHLHPKSGLILDGRHRFAACVLAGVEPKFEDWDGKGSELDFVADLNLRRRDLTKGQRAAIAVGLLPMLEEEARQRRSAKLKQNRTVPEKVPKRQEQIAGEARERAAALVGVNAHYVSDAKRIKEQRPEIFAQLFSGEIPSVPKAKDKIKLAEHEQKREENRKLLKSVPPLEAFKRGVKFSTIVADPPWDYLGKGSTMAPDYNTESLQNIKALPVKDKAADNCHLYLWVPNALLMSMPELLKAWDFEYVSILTWHKKGRGLGRTYFRNTTEQVIFAVRGSQPTKTHAIETFFEFTSEKGHSTKPEEFITKVVEPSSHSPYLELFGRKPRPGWTVWGEIAAKMLRKMARGKRGRGRVA